jgi:uncharacterized protein (TIGR02266 family)
MAIVSMNVRFAAETVDEFVERHAVNVSSLGIYLPTDRPSPLDTLVQLQLQLTGGHTIIAGLGRVVWTRDAAQATATRAPGMGVKFVKLDERSRVFVRNLVDGTQDAGRAYDEEAEQTAATADEPPLAAQRIAARRTPPRPFASATSDASLLGRIPFLRKPGADSSVPPPRSTPSSRPPVERSPSSIPSPRSPTTPPTTTPIMTTGRPLPRDPRS